ncbi:hypothetical protein [Parasitella parasitica]|uniref:Uncharacterized protein n=1 Tax=Parasitella parasitica TaxID=35722 RepID=A0A0B7MW23_9FUNG|nr:hypothetical protein [Parasitella parasitica]
MVKCYGWIMNSRRVWLQAQGHALNTTQAHICCLPNKFIPETAKLNRRNSDEPQHLFLCFELLPDVQVGDLQAELRAYCSYTQGSQTFSSETCAIEWLDETDLSWFGKQKCAIHKFGTKNKPSKQTHCRSRPANKRHCKPTSRAMSVSRSKSPIN